MRNNTVVCLAALLAIHLMFSAGCSSTMSLSYAKPPSAELDKGDISLAFSDQRPPKRGGDQPMRVGTVRNTFGMPFALNASAGRQPSKVLGELVSDCLEAAGYRVVQESSGVPRLHAVLETFWSDGYQHSRMGLVMPLELEGGQGSAIAWRHVVESDIGVTWKVGYGPFERAYNSLLEDAKHRLISEFADPGFRESYRAIAAGN